MALLDNLCCIRLLNVELDCITLVFLADTAVLLSFSAISLCYWHWLLDLVLPVAVLLFSCIIFKFRATCFTVALSLRRFQAVSARALTTSSSPLLIMWVFYHFSACTRKFPCVTHDFLFFAGVSLLSRKLRAPRAHAAQATRRYVLLHNLPLFYGLCSHSSCQSLKSLSLRCRCERL